MARLAVRLGDSTNQQSEMVMQPPNNHSVLIGPLFITPPCTYVVNTYTVCQLTPPTLRGGDNHPTQ
jgi:hypothetical protein